MLCKEFNISSGYDLFNLELSLCLVNCTMCAELQFILYSYPMSFYGCYNEILSVSV